MQGLLKTREVADMYQVSINTVLNWIYGGKLKAYRTPGGHYRISQQDLDSFALHYRPVLPNMGSFSPRLMLIEVEAGKVARESKNHDR